MVWLRPRTLLHNEMKRNKDMIRNKYVALALFVVIALIIWNLLDYLCSTIIIKSAYQFTVGGDLGFPFIGAVVVGYLLFLHKKAD